MYENLTAALGLEGFRIIGVVDGTYHLDLKVEMVCQAGFCHRCGVVSTMEIKERPLVKVRDLPVSGRKTYLLWYKRRYRCQQCKSSFTEAHPGIGPRDRLTKRFRRNLATKTADGCAHAEVARMEATTTYQVSKSFKDAAKGLLATDSEPIRRISFDEASRKKGQRDYVTVVSDLDKQCVTDALDGKGQKVLERYLDALGESNRASIKKVSIDCSPSYRKAVQAKLPCAAIVADRFHLIRACNQALSKFRARLKLEPYKPATLFDEEPEDWPTKQLLYRARFKLVKAKERLSEDEAKQIHGLLRHLPRLYVAWKLKEMFRDVYDADSRDEAKEHLDDFIRVADVTNITEFDDFLKTCRNWYEQILNYFDYEPTTNGYAEGVINKVKVTKRRAYGLPKFETYRERIMVVCGPGLPEVAPRLI